MIGDIRKVVDLNRGRRSSFGHLLQKRILPETNILSFWKDEFEYTKIPTTHALSHTSPCPNDDHSPLRSFDSLWELRELVMMHHSLSSMELG